MAGPDWTAQVQAIVAILALLLSAVGFGAVYLQLRQFNQNMQYEAYSKHIDDYSQLTQLLIDKPGLNKRFYEANTRFNELPDDEKDYYNYLGLSLGCLERTYTLHKKRWIDEITWNAWQRWFSQQWFPSPVFKLFWELESDYFNADFKEEVNRMIQKHEQRALAASDEA